MTTYIPSITIPSFILGQPAAAILLPLGLGNAVGWANRPDSVKKRYMELKQPPFNPPGYVFGPVWTLLYAGMGYASYRVWTIGLSSLDPVKRDAARHGATLYTIQLALNLLWMPLFFGLKRPIEATVDVVTLLGTTIYLTSVWSKVDNVAAYLMIPYLGWLSFATYLSAGCGYLNDWDFKKPKQPKLD